MFSRRPPCQAPSSPAWPATPGEQTGAQDSNLHSWVHCRCHEAEQAEDPVGDGASQLLDIAGPTSLHPPSTPGRAPHWPSHPPSCRHRQTWWRPGSSWWSGFLRGAARVTPGVAPAPGGAILAETETRQGKNRPKVTPCISSMGNTWSRQREGDYRKPESPARASPWRSSKVT